MKTKNVNVRSFRQGYEDLYQLGYQTADQMVTDSKEFTEFGIDQSDKENLLSLLETVKNRSFDKLIVLQQILITQEKNNIIEEIRKELFKLEVTLRKSFSPENPFYKALEINSVSTMTDTNIVEKVLSLNKLLSMNYATAYTPVISQEKLSELSTKALQAQDLIRSQKAAKIERKLATSIRVENANKLYDEIVRIRYVGKQMWALTNSIKSESYLLPRQQYASTTKLETDADEESFEVKNPIVNSETESTSNS